MLNTGSTRPALLLATLGLCLLSSCSAPDPADLVLLNGKVVTLDEALFEATALAIQGDRVAALGSDAEMKALVGPSTSVIDLGGRLAIPGFIEGHGHFTGIGQAKRQLDLTRLKNWEEAVEMVRQAVSVSQPGDWILGRGWHQEKWDAAPEPEVEGLPTHASLSRVSPDNPVLLTHASGHASFVNSKALELAGITTGTPDPEGGKILRDGRGSATGVLRETAQNLVRRAQAESMERQSASEKEAELREQIRLAAEECLSKGITSFQDAGSSFATVDTLKNLAAEGNLPIRLWVMLREGNDALKRSISDYRLIGYAAHRLTVRAIKRSIDGALGSHGAWLLEPYTDLPGNTGLNTTPVESIVETAKIALENDFQLCVHAIGDRANRETLDIFEQAYRTRPDKRDLRWRVEHAQHLHPDDIPRFAALGVIASMQGVHCTSDGPWVPIRLGEQRTREGAYVWQKLMRTGAVVTNGTDAPVEDVSPVSSFHSSVTRRLSDGSVFLPEERMTRVEALRSYTLQAAYAAFEEDVKGSLAPGKLADITVLDRDILTIPEDEIIDTKVVYTIVGGKIAFDGRRNQTEG